MSCMRYEKLGRNALYQNKSGNDKLRNKNPNKVMSLPRSKTEQRKEWKETIFMELKSNEFKH